MMMRTFSPKHALYFGDGTGRDTYVVTNDGGLRDLDKVGMTRRPFKNTIKTNIKGPVNEPMAVSYHSDGTGRDTYVIKNSGGLYNDFHGSSRADINFVSSLRKSPKSRFP